MLLSKPWLLAFGLFCFAVWLVGWSVGWLVGFEKGLTMEPWLAWNSLHIYTRLALNSHRSASQVVELKVCTTKSSHITLTFSFLFHIYIYTYINIYHNSLLIFLLFHIMHSSPGLEPGVVHSMQGSYWLSYIPVLPGKVPNYHLSH